MRPHDSHRRRPRDRSRPTLEGLEPRELPSGALASSTASVRPTSRHATAAIVAHPDSPNGLIGKKAPGPFLNPTVIKRAAAALYHANVPPGTPTPRRSAARLSQPGGSASIRSAPRFSDRASTIHVYGVSGGSNQFLKGKFQIALFPPADPGATPTPGNPYANQITGVAALFGQNFLQSGSIAGARHQRHAGTRFFAGRPADATHLDLRLNTRRALRRRQAGSSRVGIHSGRRHARAPLDSRSAPAPGHPGIGQGRRHVPGPDQHQPDRQRGLEVHLLADRSG